MAKKLRMKSCDFCGNPFEPHDARQKYCSAACKQATYRRNVDSLVGSAWRQKAQIEAAVETKRNTLKEVTCPVCNRVFTAEIIRTQLTYCSAACKQKAYRKKRDARNNTPIC